MAGRFVATPELPGEGLLLSQAILFGAIKENVELLTGTRGESDLASRALVRGDITVALVGQQDMTQVTPRSPQGYLHSAISGTDEVASLTALRALTDDVQVLANDLYRTRLALDTLIRNLGG